MKGLNPRTVPFCLGLANVAVLSGADMCLRLFHAIPVCTVLLVVASCLSSAALPCFVRGGDAKGWRQVLRFWPLLITILLEGLSTTWFILYDPSLSRAAVTPAIRYYCELAWVIAIGLYMITFAIWANQQSSR